MSDDRRTILITGAAGFIGRHLCAQLAADGSASVVRLLRLPDPSKSESVRAGDPSSWTSLPALLATERIDACVHLAWYARDADYLDSPANAACLADSHALIDALCRNGVRHFVGVGTCLEKLPDDHVLRAKPYVQAKLRFCQAAAQTCAKAGVAFSWARVFFPYGPGEPARKLVSLMAGRVARGEAVGLQSPDNPMDLVFVTDVARAFTSILTRQLTGTIDIGTGTATTARAVATIVGGILDRPVIGLSPPAPPTLVIPPPETNRLHSADWTPSVDLATGIRQTILSLTPHEHTRHLEQ